MPRSTKEAYNDADGYGVYEAGEIDDDLFIEDDLFDFDKSQHSYPDKKLWQTLQTLLDRLSEQKKVLQILDMGCGTGTWLLRILAYCRSKGVYVHAVGIDLVPSMIEKAGRRLCRYRRLYPDFAFSLVFEEVDARKQVPFSDRTFDLTLCFYTVLNHLLPQDLQRAINEMLQSRRNLSAC